MHTDRTHETPGKASVDAIRERFDRAVEYLSDVERGQSALMDAPLALDLVACTAAAVTPNAGRVLDVGCGGGNYSIKLLQYLPDVDVTLLDLSDALLERARERVSTVTAGQVITIAGDVREVDLGLEEFDIVVAGAVFHHLRGEDEWKVVFKKMYRTLRPGGSLWISDLIDHARPEVRVIMEDRYGQYLEETRGRSFREVVFEEIAEQDSPRPLLYQVDLLRSVGFDEVEVLHKNACFATFGAIKGA